MSDQPKLYLAGTGMITSIGFNTDMTAAAVRAGVSGFESTDLYLDDENYVRMARVPGEVLDNSLNEEALPEEFGNRQIRLLQLATLALSQLQPMPPRNLKLPLFLAGPEQLMEGDRPIDGEFLQLLMKQTGVAMDLAASRVISTGRAGGLAAVDLAFRFLAASDQPFAIVGGVDTFYDGRLLQMLLEEDRLLVGGNMDGFIPGEAAAFLLLTRNKTPPFQNTDQAICLCEPGQASEPGHRYSQEPYRGDGLAQALTAALNNAQTGKIKNLFSSMNGEHLFAKEHGVAIVRNSDRLEEGMRIEHPADCFGDIGAAFAPVAVGILAVYLINRKLPSPSVICCSSDKAPRAAMVMHV